jgi:acetolactate synthase-1/2/3 large subunit
MITGAEALIKSLLEEGVDTVFGYPGGAILPVYDKLYDYTDRLRHILVRHEQGATHAAQGYARSSGRPGVVIATSGPGATNLVTGIADAMTDSTPMVVITGQVGTNFLGSDAFQETDVIGITMPVTKWALQVRHAEDVPAAVARAFYIATNGRPGPVVLDLAKEAQLSTLSWHYEKVNFIRSYNPYPDLSPAQLSMAATLINNSQRPMILAGQGVTLSHAEDALMALATKADIPIAATLLGKSAVDHDSPLYKGMLGMHGNIGPNFNTNRADLIIAVGMRFDDRVTGITSRYARQAQIIHIDIDRSEFDKNITAGVKIHSDARCALEQLLPMVQQASRREWHEAFDRCARYERDHVIDRAIHPVDRGMTMPEVINKISEAASDRAIAVTDVGQNQMFTARYFNLTRHRQLITSGGLGTMGFGLPAAIGAKIARPDYEVFSFVGDGGIQMTGQELGTIMQYDVPVKIVILNNNFLGNVRQWQQLFYHSRFSQTPMLNPDFAAIADAYGIGGENVADRAQLDGAIERMLKSEHAYLLNVNIDPEDMIFPMIAPGTAVDEILINDHERYNEQ